MDTHYIDIHTHTRKPGSLCVVSYCVGRDNIPGRVEKPFTAGIHPWDAAHFTWDKLNIYFTYLYNAPLAAIGEAGLDYLRGGDHKKQLQVLRAQLDIADSRTLPVVVHCVKAYNDMLAVIKSYPQLIFILHGYTGSPQQTKEALALGCYISVGQRSLESPKTNESIKIIPADRLFCETDESDIPIASVYRRLAEIKQMQTAVLAAAIEDNFNRIFTL